LIVSVVCHVTDDLDRDLQLLKPICLATGRQLGAAAFLQLAGISLDDRHLPAFYPDISHAEDEREAVRIASAVVTDEMVRRFAEAFCLVGTAASIQEQIQTAMGYGVTGFQIRPLGQQAGNYRLPDALIDSFADHVLPAFRTAAARP
jgi:alkanesulfonate monooxygenase SsuD/methylene tetrahydromethanopterin reductase-like flavin-dependent oxidoreductase (luciferase family)